MKPFATLADLTNHWPDLPENKEEEAEHKLKEASTLVRGLYPATDGKIKAGTLSEDVVVLVVCDVVKEALNISDDEAQGNLSQATFGAGPFTRNLSFRSREGNLFLKKLHRQLLTGGGSRSRRAFTIMPGGS